MKKVFNRVIVIGILYFIPGPSHAQMNNNILTDHTRENVWRYTSLKETPYQCNGRVIQQQLAVLGKKLNYLSTVDALTYSQLQGELHGYLQQLENDSPDYGSTQVYHDVLLRLMQFEELIKKSLTENRQHDSRGIAADVAKPDDGREAAVLPYALLFRHQDYRSKLVHIVTSGKVTVLKHGPIYCLVRCGTHKGYLHTGMIL